VVVVVRLRKNWFWFGFLPFCLFVNVVFFLYRIYIFCPSLPKHCHELVTHSFFCSVVWIFFSFCLSWLGIINIIIIIIAIHLYRHYAGLQTILFGLSTPTATAAATTRTGTGTAVHQSSVLIAIIQQPRNNHTRTTTSVDDDYYDDDFSGGQTRRNNHHLIGATTSHFVGAAAITISLAPQRRRRRSNNIDQQQQQQQGRESKDQWQYEPRCEDGPRGSFFCCSSTSFFFARPPAHGSFPT